MTQWLTLQETCSRFRCSYKVLRARMHETPSHMAIPWVDHGTPPNSRITFDPSLVDGWWREVHAWRASGSGGVLGSSGGETLTAPSAPGSAPPARQRRRSVARSKKPPPSADGGNLVMLAARTSRPA